MLFDIEAPIREHNESVGVKRGREASHIPMQIDFYTSCVVFIEAELGNTDNEISN